ncbi:MAG TPA: MaoC family dehydratase N-terminal domain-containing protein [Caldimonas sp.]|nr:MaoC family dehydratase N-terminal domain-containing protein [Caldimonas sp.]HEX2539470.1 MaoC family dehydratase N-terminal domain-containing protein [Caldimonas sp.]
MSSRDDYTAWIGRTEERSDTITPVPVAALAATLDRDDPPPQWGTLLPPLWHWLYFLPVHRQGELGPDGHPRRGGFLPPVALPRRMWAGSRLRFERDLRVGDEVTRTSRIAAVAAKESRSGPLVFVTVEHRIGHGGGIALREEHDIVYRELPAPGTPPAVAPPAPTDEGFARDVDPDDVLLFRYSALTFNGHRIHYDRRYVTEAEGYPGLVVHGPLIATLLLDLLRRHRPAARVASFDFKAVSPLFDGRRFSVCGRPEGERSFALWARNGDGGLAMQAGATID